MSRVRRAYVVNDGEVPKRLFGWVEIDWQKIGAIALILAGAIGIVLLVRSW
ncbi:MAG: hypothetical protein HY397_01010 [Candidatus Doudnabacteria bacterium]|nr:hypothetical protein [Candidatus Doudnabacteria bacterium]